MTMHEQLDVFCTLCTPMMERSSLKALGFFSRCQKYLEHHMLLQLNCNIFIEKVLLVKELFNVAHSLSPLKIFGFYREDSAAPYNE